MTFAAEFFLCRQGPDFEHDRGVSQQPDRDGAVLTPDLAARKWITHGLRQAQPLHRLRTVVGHHEIGFFALSKSSLRVDSGLRAYALGCGNEKIGLLNLGYSAPLTAWGRIELSSRGHRHEGRLAHTQPEGYRVCS